MDHSEDKARGRTTPGWGGLTEPHEDTGSGPVPFDRPAGEAEVSSPSLDGGDFFARLGEHSQALQIYLDLWSNPAFHGELSLAARIANCQVRLGRHLEAIHLLAPLVAQAAPAEFLDPEDRRDLGQCRLELGKAYLEAGRLAEAEAEGHLALMALGAERPGERLAAERFGPDGAAAPEAPGELARGATTGAVRDVLFRQVYGYVHNLLAAVAGRRGDVDEARRYCRIALESFRSQGDVRNLAACYTNLGNLYKLRCEWDRALEHYQAAYYLRATEGEYKDRAVSHQNIGLVLMRVGRYEEAREQLEKALVSAIQSSDPTRLLRSRLALARLARESLDTTMAREHLAECQHGASGPLPEREACLLLLEEAHLARIERRFLDASAAAQGLRERTERLASRGDLMVETWILEGSLETEQRRWAEADELFRRALDLSKEDQDRDQENRALFGRMEICARRGDLTEADRIFHLLEDRHRHGGEQPALARLFLARARIEQQIRKEPREALVWSVKARDLWRRMGQQRLADTAETAIADALLDLDRATEAAALVRGLRERLGHDASGAGLLHACEVLEERLRSQEEERTVPVVDGEQALRRLEEVLASRQGFSDLVRGSLQVLVEALQAEGALWARVEGTSCEVISSISMGWLRGRRAFSTDVLGLRDPRKADLLLPGVEASGRSTGMVAPVSLGGRDYVVYLEKREALRPTYSRSDLDYARVLVAEVVRGLRKMRVFEDLSAADAGAAVADRPSARPAPADASAEEVSGGSALPDAQRGIAATGTAAPGTAVRGIGAPASASPVTAAPATAAPVTSARGIAVIDEVRRGIFLADVVTQHPRMLSILELIRKVSGSDLTVLLQGETGTGKKLLAQAVHRTSGRQDRPFVTVDCAALPENLLESELFGHKKGAFTGAVADRVGLLEEANGGTIFLDEIDKAGLLVQRRFLHMLDSGEVRPVGSTSYRTLDVRVVCATSSPDLRVEIEAGRFLKDLYYRLNDISIMVPALRERAEDVPLLAEWFIGKFAAELGREVGNISPAFFTALGAHAWPGNVRELEKAVRRAVTLLDSGGVLVPDLLPLEVLESNPDEMPGVSTGSLKERVELYERRMILDVLDSNEWNKSRTAQLLGLTRRGLKSKIQRYKLDRRRMRRL